MPDRKEYMRQYRLKKKMQNFKKPIKRAKTAAEHQKEYRARKKAKKLAAAAGNSDAKDNIKIVKTAAEYQREYRARMKALKPCKSEDSVRIVKTAAEYQREYRARMKATKPCKPENSVKKVKTAAEYQREYRARMKAKKLKAAAMSMSTENIKVVKTAAERQRECRLRKKASKLDNAGMNKFKDTIKTVKAAAERQRECRDMLRKHILYKDACLRPLLDLSHCTPQSPVLCGPPPTPAADLLNIVSPAHPWSAATSLPHPWMTLQDFISPTFAGECDNTSVPTKTMDPADQDVPVVKSEPKCPADIADEGEDDHQTSISDGNVKTEKNSSWIPAGVPIKMEIFPDLPIEFDPKTDAREDCQGCNKIDIKQESDTSSSKTEGNLINPYIFAIKPEPSSPAETSREKENESTKFDIDRDVSDTDIMQGCLDLSRNSEQH